MKSRKASAWSVFLAFLRLGLTSFGGPVAHLGYFREEFVARRRWLREDTYADLVALCQFLPGPASSQVGIGIGLSQAGLRGALAAWTGFTLPSAVALILFASGLTLFDSVGADASWLRGLKVAAVAVVALAIWGMAKTLCPDRSRATLALLAAGIALGWQTVLGQIAAIAVGAVFGWKFLKPAGEVGHETHLFSIGRKQAFASISLFILLLFGLPLLPAVVGGQIPALVDSFFRSGSLVFGGGHVVLPLLQAEVVEPGWISRDLFLAGYGAVQAVPGPLFTFSSYLGAAMQAGPGGWAGGLICLLAIFAPSFLLVIGILPFWESLRKKGSVRSALMGINAAVVGLLLAAFYDPVWVSGIHAPADVILGLVAYALLSFWKAPPWAVVIGCGLAGALIMPG